MKKKVFLSLLLILPLSLSGCATSLTKISKTYKDLAKIKVDMSKLEVIKIAGHPYEKETFVLEDGQLIQFYKYITGYTLDGPVLNSDLTPICFQDDKVIGRGRKFYNNKKRTTKKFIYP